MLSVREKARVEIEIIIRHVEPDDYEAVHRVFAGPKAVAGTLQLPMTPRETWRKRLSETTEGRYQLVACVDGEVVGELTLWALNNPRQRHVGGFRMAVRDDWQLKGIGTALLEAALDLADNWLNLTRVELTVYTDNAAAIALYEKFGFEIEGTHRRYVFRDGAFVDAYSMARLRE